jgi:hypothetical protein
MSKTIQITISPKGETKIETQGFTGSSCQDATRAMEAALGSKTSDTMTSEYYTASNEQTNEIEN